MGLRSNKRVWVIAVLLGTVLVSWWLKRSGGPALDMLSGAPRHDPDYYFKDFVMTAMGEDGGPRHELSAQSLVHFPDDDTAALEEPHLVMYTPAGGTWDVSAVQGQVTDGGRAVRLLGDVRVVRSGTEQGLAIYTSELDVLPEREYAETDQAVRIEQSAGVTTAVGMRADLRDQQLRLLARVRGSYHEKQAD